MIRNERQHRVTRTQRARLADKLADIAQADVPEWVKSASAGSLNAQIMDLDSELAEYTALRQGLTASVAAVTALQDLPRALVAARVASGMTHKELGDRLGLREQQIQRYEANNYAGANVARLEEVMAALDVTFNGEVELPPNAGNGAALRRGLQSIGLSKETLSRRFFGLGADAGQSSGWMIAAARAARIFDVGLDEVIAGTLPQRVSAGAFRASTSANREAINGYALYAEYVAGLLVKVCVPEYRPLPLLETLRADLGEDLVSKPLEALTRTAWEHGIPVLPLSDPGTFYGACWQIGGRPAVALKNSFRTPDRWAFLLAHELEHASKPSDTTVVLEADLSVREWREQPAERAADEFASNLLLGADVEALVRVAVELADNQVSKLEAVLPSVAVAGDVSLGLLADHVANRVQADGINWWPVANRLHSRDQDAWQVVRNCLFDYVDLSRIDGLDRDILVDGIGL